MQLYLSTGTCVSGHRLSDLCPLLPWLLFRRFRCHCGQDRWWCLRHCPAVSWFPFLNSPLRRRTSRPRCWIYAKKKYKKKLSYFAGQDNELRWRFRKIQKVYKRYLWNDIAKVLLQKYEEKLNYFQSIYVWITTDFKNVQSV